MSDQLHLIDLLISYGADEKIRNHDNNSVWDEIQGSKNILMF
jgi:hypothetical protein